MSHHQSDKTIFIRHPLVLPVVSQSNRLSAAGAKPYQLLRRNASVGDASQHKEPSSTQFTAVPSRGLTLEQAIQTALEADPKIQAGLEVITQAKADFLTASLPRNPQVSTSGTLLPLAQPFTVNQQGGPPQFDVGMSYPIDWFLFGKRAAAITGARLGVDVSAADFADLVRQRVAGTIAAFYDVWKREPSSTWRVRISTISNG